MLSVMGPVVRAIADKNGEEESKLAKLYAASATTAQTEVPFPSY